MRTHLIAGLLSLAALIQPVLANENVPPDRIVLTVTEEAWVETETARVVAEIKTLITDNAAGTSAAEPMTILDQVGLGHWHITGSHRQQTDTGFEQLLIVAEARLAQTALPGIYERAESVSEKGRTVRILAVDFSPSLQEREATAAQLRQTIYARAAAEAKAVAEQFPEQGFRVHQVHFQDGANGPRPMPAVKSRMLSADASAEQMPAPPPGQQVSERMTLSASVVIAAPGRD
jgi:hypothetical protein